MIKRIVVYILVFFVSCNKDKFEEKYFSNGNTQSITQVNDANIANGLFEEYYESGELKVKGMYSNGKMTDTLYVYYKNGNIKEKGLIQDKYKLGWWLYYNESGSLEEKNEYKISKKNRLFENQTIKYNNDGTINYDKSWFFKINISDTLNQGKNLGSINYYSYSKADEKFMYVVVDNEYDNLETKKDTFADKFEFSKFMFYAKKKGKVKLSGEVIEEEIIYGNDSTDLIINTHTKYFEKEVYVKGGNGTDR